MLKLHLSWSEYTGGGQSLRIIDELQSVAPVSRISVCTEQDGHVIVPILHRHVEHHGYNREKRIGCPCIVLSNIEAEEIDPGRKDFRVAEILTPGRLIALGWTRRSARSHRSLAWKG